MNQFSTEEKLSERIKELSCLYEVTNILNQQTIALDEIFVMIAQRLKEAMRFPSDTIVQISHQNFQYSTSQLSIPTTFIKDILQVENSKIGEILIHYPSHQYSEKDFLEDEVKLLRKICFEISFYLEIKENQIKEAQLKKSAERADRLSILGEITAGIAHELNTPLGNILGFAELIKQQNQIPQINNDVDKIINAAIYSREIVKNLMFFSCEMPQNKSIYEVKPVIMQALTLLGPNFKKQDIIYKVNFSNDKIMAQIDKIQLTQVMFNILLNALYVSPAKSEIHVNVYSNEEYFVIEIKDHGPGIKDDIKQKIFEPFFTTKPIGEGTGLGLSVVHGIVKSHKGEIEAIDNTPRGTIFRMKLPIN
jgi:signal transduction histidine kinase